MPVPQWAVETVLSIDPSGQTSSAASPDAYIAPDAANETAGLREEAGRAALPYFGGVPRDTWSDAAGKRPGIDEFLRHGDDLLVRLPRRYRVLATVLGPLARAAGSRVGWRGSRRTRSGPEGLEAQAEKFEASADQMTAELTADQLAAPLAPEEVTDSRWPADPRWKRRAIENLRQSARELREIAAQRRAEAD